MKVWRRHACHAKVHPHAREFPANANIVSVIVSRIPQIIEVTISRGVCGAELILQRSDRTLEFSGARSVSAATPCSAACQSTPPVVQLTQSVIPATRKTFQLPSGIFLYTMSTLPRRCTGAPPGDVINETVYGRHSTAQPPSRKINSLYSGT